MTDPPYTLLKSGRNVDTTLVGDLRDFYSEYEGCGLSTELRAVRLCTYSELKNKSWSDLLVLGEDPVPEHWENFKAIRIGMGRCFEEFLYILQSDVFQPGSIIAMGISVVGPGGSGPHAIEPSLILARSFTEWLMWLERCGWEEMAFCTDSDAANALPCQERIAVLQKLNPRCQLND